MIDPRLTTEVEQAWTAVKDEFERAKAPDEPTVPFLKLLQQYRRALVAETFAQAVDSVQGRASR